MTEAELKQFIALEVHALVTPLLSGVHQLLDEVRAAEKNVFETARKHLRRLDGRISRQLTQTCKNAEHRERTLNALLLAVAEIRRRLGIDSASPTDEPDYRN